MTWTIDELCAATDGRFLGSRPDSPVKGIAIDSRTLAAGQAYVAIRGRRLDGHDFVSEAIRRGASALVVSRLDRAVAEVMPTVLVDDTTEALLDLAHYHRRRWGKSVVAVTGSCGKTTTKELIAHLLGGPPGVLKNVGTQNNHIGVPLTLLRLQADHELAVVELGSNHPGEIAQLASITKPNVAVITNVGPAHLEFFGSLVNVLCEKLSLLEALPPDGCAVLPGDQLDVWLEAKRFLDPRVRVVSFGTSDRCDIQAVDIQRSHEGMLLRLRDHLGQWTVPLPGYHNVENALAALACAWAMGVPLSVAKARLASFVGPVQRSQVIRHNGFTILNDCYNANPLSVARALEMLRDLPVRRRIAVLGDMLELGAFSQAAHRTMGQLAGQLGVDLVLAVGEHAAEIAQGVQERRTNGIMTYRTIDELLQQLPDMLQPGDGVLVKGSRKLQLERVTEFLLRETTAAQQVSA